MLLFKKKKKNISGTQKIQEDSGPICTEKNCSSKMSVFRRRIKLSKYGWLVEL